MSVQRRLIASYVRIADGDLRSARLLAQNGLRNAWYECEQAAEKLIRAILTSEGIRGGVHHRLHEMVDLVPDANPLKPALREIESLASYATTFRYPTDSGKIPEPKGDIDQIIGKVQRVLDACVRCFGVDLTSKDALATRSDPPR